MVGVGAALLRLTGRKLESRKPGSLLLVVVGVQQRVVVYARVFVVRGGVE